MDYIDKLHIAALTLVQHIDHGIITGLKHYRTKKGRFLNTLNEVIVAITEDDLMLSQLEQVGILYENKEQLPFDIAIGKAVTKFLHCDHCGKAHRTPEEVHFNPSEDVRVVESFPYRLTPVPNKNIAPGRIRICTKTEPEGVTQ